MGQVHLDLGIGAERLEDDVAALALGGFLFRQLTGLDEPLHQRLVLGDLGGDALADEVGAAVADLGEEEVIGEHAGGGRRRPHAADFRMGFGVRMDVGVGDFDRFLQPVGEALRGRFLLGAPHFAHLIEDRVGRHHAGDLARGGAAHAVRDHEQRAALPHVVLALGAVRRPLSPGEIRDEEAILVVLAGLTGVGPRIDLDSNGFRRASEHAYWHCCW